MRKIDRKKFAETKTATRLNQSYGREVVSIIGSKELLKEDEYASRRVQLGDRYAKFEVDFDFKKHLCQLVKKIDDTEVVLPFEFTRFILNYRINPLSVIVMQDPKTFELTIFSTTIAKEPVLTGAAIRSMGESESRVVIRNHVSELMRRHISGTHAEHHTDVPVILTDELRQELLDEVRYICMALEVKIADKAPLVVQYGTAKVKQTPGDVYRVTTVKPLNIPNRKNAEPKYHQRFHIRRAHWKGTGDKRKRIGWYFAGDISLGVITKDYDVTKETLGTA